VLLTSISDAHVLKEINMAFEDSNCGNLATNSMKCSTSQPMGCFSNKSQVHGFPEEEIFVHIEVHVLARPNDAT
jgi:hypothetical protein